MVGKRLSNREMYLHCIYLACVSWYSANNYVAELRLRYIGWGNYNYIDFNAIHNNTRSHGCIVYIVNAPTYVESASKIWSNNSSSLVETTPNRPPGSSGHGDKSVIFINARDARVYAGLCIRMWEKVAVNFSFLSVCWLSLFLDLYVLSTLELCYGINEASHWLALPSG